MLPDIETVWKSDMFILSVIEDVGKWNVLKHLMKVNAVCSRVLTLSVMVEIVSSGVLIVLYTEIPSDLPIHSKLTHLQNYKINKQIKHHKHTFQNPDVV